MRRVVLIGFGVVALLAVAMMVSVWHANQEPVTRTPGPLDMGRAQLHEKLAEAKIWVLPNPSGLNAHYGLRELAGLFAGLRAAVETDGR